MHFEKTIFGKSEFIEDVHSLSLLDTVCSMGLIERSVNT